MMRVPAIHVQEPDAIQILSMAAIPVHVCQVSMEQTVLRILMSVPKVLLVNMEESVSIQLDLLSAAVKRVLPEQDARRTSTNVKVIRARIRELALISAANMNACVCTDLRAITAKETEMNACKIHAETTEFVQMRSTVTAAHVSTDLAAKTAKATWTTVQLTRATTAAPVATHSTVLSVIVRLDSMALVARIITTIVRITCANMVCARMELTISHVGVTLDTRAGCVTARLICATIIHASMVVSVKKPELVTSATVCPELMEQTARSTSMNVHPTHVSTTGNARTKLTDSVASVNLATEAAYAKRISMSV